MRHKAYEKLSDEDIYHMLLIVCKGAYPSKLTDTWEKIPLLEKSYEPILLLDFIIKYISNDPKWHLLNEAKKRYDKTKD